MSSKNWSFFFSRIKKIGSSFSIFQKKKEEDCGLQAYNHSYCCIAAAGKKTSSEQGSAQKV